MLMYEIVNPFIQTEVQTPGNAHGYPGYKIPSALPYSSFITYKEVCLNITLQ